MKKSIGPALVFLSTLALTFLTIFLGGRFYLLRNQPVSPNVPVSFPKAAEPVKCEALVINFGVTASASPLSSTSPTPTYPATGGQPTASPTPTPTYSCDSSCTTNAQCQTANSNYICYSSSGTCRHQDHPGQQNCLPQATIVTASTPTPTPVPGCYSTCNSNSDCMSGMSCQTVSGVQRCVNPSCANKSNCVCSSSSPATARPSSSPELPVSGTSLPTILGIGVAITLILTALKMALL